MARPDAYDTSQPRTYNCIVCNQLVGVEQHEDWTGRIWYSPASRYWHDDGVFCSVKCGLEHSRRCKEYERPS